jgi:hypothetical protein
MGRNGFVAWNRISSVTSVLCGADAASYENGERGGELLQGQLSALPDVLRLGAV